MMQYMDSGMYTLIRLLLGSVILLIACKVKNGGLKIARNDLLRFFLCGASAMSLYYTLEGFAFTMISASMGSLLLATIPIFGIAADRLLFKRKITKVKIICIFVSIAGVYLVVSGDLSASKLIGLGIMVICAILWTFQIIVIKPLHDRYDLLTILTGTFISGFIMQIPLTLLTGTHAEFTPDGVEIMLFTTVFCLVVAQAGYVFAIKHLSVTIVSAFENMLPVITIALSFVMYGTMLSPVQLAGAALIISSVTILVVKDQS
jgi:drug/metabolite transporter (DMT)-like permease